LRVSERANGSQRAGSIQPAAAGQHLKFTSAKRQVPGSTQIPLWFEIQLNRNLSTESRYGTLIHELAHLYCGHLGTPNGRRWPDRQNLSQVVREFEAESVGYLVCVRLGVDTASDEYLAGYVRKCPVTPAISLARILYSCSKKWDGHVRGYENQQFRNRRALALMATFRSDARKNICGNLSLRANGPIANSISPSKGSEDW